MAKWFWRITGKVLYTHSAEICEVIGAYDVSFQPWATACVPARLPMPMTKLKFAELQTQGELTENRLGKWCQVMNEGPGHNPDAPDQGEMGNSWIGAVKRPSTHSGRSRPNIAPGYDHITSAIGAAMIGWYGLRHALLRYAQKHLVAQQERCEGRSDCLQNRRALPPTWPKGHPSARLRDDALSKGGV